MIYAKLVVTEGIDGNYYFIPMEVAYWRWKHLDGEIIVLSDARVKVEQILYGKPVFGNRELLQVYLERKANGSNLTYRLD